MLLPTDSKPIEACTRLLAEYEEYDREYDDGVQVDSPEEEEVKQESHPVAPGLPE